jgi:hypothetical protein
MNMIRFILPYYLFLNYYTILVTQNIDVRKLLNSKKNNYNLRHKIVFFENKYTFVKIQLIQFSYNKNIIFHN